MYIESVPNRNSPPRRPAARVLPPRRQIQKTHPGQSLQMAPRPDQGLADSAQGRYCGETVQRRLRHPALPPPHGHVAAVLGTLKRLRLDRLIARQRSPERDRAVAMFVARVLAPGSKLATARNLAEATAADSLADTLGLGAIDEEDLYAAMDWLLKLQGRIERALTKRHLNDGALVLYDLTSV